MARTNNNEHPALRALPWLAIAAFVAYFFAPLRHAPSLEFWDAPSGSDAVLQGTFIKSMIETGWVFRNDRLGAPFGTEFFDFPGADAALLIIIKVFSLFTSDSSLVMTLFYASGFLLVFAAAYWVLRRVGIDALWATVAALTYACLPYHFLRGTNHLYLSNYFIVPLLTWLSLRIYPGEGSEPSPLPTKWGWREGAVLLLGGSCGVYYAFFGMMLILVTGLLGTVHERSRAYLVRSLLAMAVIAAGVLLNIAPNLYHSMSRGVNTEVATRTAVESDVYGLRAAQMLLPFSGHRNARAAALGAPYLEGLRPVTEAGSSALGILGAAGFLLLLGHLFFARAPADRRLQVLSRMNLALFAFATVGGFAVLFALFVTPQFRGVNRASVYIGFISLLGLSVWAQARLARAARLAGFRWAALPLAALVVFAMLYDQVPSGARAPFDAKTDPARWPPSNFARFIGQVEADIPRGGMVYVMPYIPFPESPPAFEEGYNALLRPYYYSQHARWSYGAMRGRTGDTWLKAVEALPLEQRLAALRKTGFSGIYVERKAFRDHGAALEGDLRRLLGVTAIESADRTQAFYRMQADPKPEITPSRIVAPGPGFYAFERGAGREWIWSARSAQLRLENFTNHPIQVRFHVELTSLDERRVQLQFDGKPVMDATLRPGTGVPVALDLTLAPGPNALALSSSAPDVRLRTDPRALAVMWIQPSMEPR